MATTTQLLDLMFSAGLSPALTEALHYVAFYVPQMLEPIQGIHWAARVSWSPMSPNLEFMAF
jgi:hypothetical protein